MELGKTYDLDAAYALYLERFGERFGDKPDGAFVRLEKHMVSKLSHAAFGPRLAHYLRMHEATKQMLSSGATISDTVVMEFAEAAAWVCVKAPDLLGMFRGELGDPDATAPMLRRAPSPTRR